VTVDYLRSLTSVGRSWLSQRCSCPCVKIDQYMPCNVQHAAIGGAAVYITRCSSVHSQQSASIRIVLYLVQVIPHTGQHLDQDNTSTRTTPGQHVPLIRRTTHMIIHRWRFEHRGTLHFFSIVSIHRGLVVLHGGRREQRQRINDGSDHGMQDRGTKLMAIVDTKWLPCLIQHDECCGVSMQCGV
jgi:hypothetical protein